MLAINKGVSGVLHIFRGTAAQDFVLGLDIRAHQQCLVLLPHGRRERARFFLTVGGTGCLFVDAEDLPDAVARLAYNKVWKLLRKDLGRFNGRA